MALITFTSGSQLPAADLNANFTELTRTALTIIPTSAIGESSTAPQLMTLSVNTTAIIGQVVIPFKITVNKISVMVNLVTTAGTIDLSLYSEDGQTRLFSVTTASLTTSSIATTGVSAVVVQPGIYYIMANSNSTTEANFYTWGDQTNPFTTNAATSLMNGVTSEPVLQGTMTITAGTPPTTFNPVSAITAVYYSTMIVRLDN